MQSSENKTNKALVDAAGTDSQATGAGIGSRIAPAVALLLLGDSAHAQIIDEDTINVPEPSTLVLLAAGAVVGGAAKYIHNKRRKK
ncbi:MAG: PEP-CTERM sorting domain-containing protein [Gammaproteobacteria bacterium]